MNTINLKASTKQSIKLIASQIKLVQIKLEPEMSRVADKPAHGSNSNKRLFNGLLMPVESLPDVINKVSLRKA